MSAENALPSSYTPRERDERLVHERVASGRYVSFNAVVRDGLRLIEEREQRRNAKLEALRKDIADGLESGAPEPLNIDSIKAEGRRRLAATGRA